MAAADIAKLFDLSGQVACLTGGAGGMGRSTGIVLAQAGATVILADINEAGLEETARFIEDAGGKASTVRCDVTNEAEVEALVAKAVTDHGRIDIMGNIAGIFQQSRIMDTTEQMMDDLFAINLKGVFYGVKHALNAMIPQKRGSIVNVSSGIIDFTGTANSALYGMSKAAVAMLGKTAAAEGAPHGVRVNTIAPGVVITGFSEHNWRDAEGRKSRDAGRPISRPPRSTPPSASSATPTTSPTPSSTSSLRPATSSPARSSAPTAASRCPGNP